MRLKMTDFEQNVKTMRDLQKRYFQTRDYEILKQARAAEEKVDRKLEEIEHGPRLFPEQETANGKP